MKRILVMAIVCAFFCAATIANATEINVSGQFDFAAKNVTNSGMSEDGDSSGVEFRQRFRTQIDIVQSENLKGVVFFEIGETVWGNGSKLGQGSGGGLGADGVNVETRRAYIDFVVPNTLVRMQVGLMGLALPSATYGSPVLDDDVAAAAASYSAGNFGLTAIFARPYFSENPEYDDEGIFISDHEDLTGDVFAVIGSIEADKFSLSPYAVYGDIENEFVAGIEEDLTIYWLGVAATFNVNEKLSVGIDAIYSKAEAEEEADGYFLAAKIARTGDFMTLELGGWYSTGANAEDDEGFAPFSGAYCPTSFGFDGYNDLSGGDVFSTDGVNTSGVALTVKEVSFIENVSHRLTVAYMQYTDKAHEDDSAYEADFETTWQMYENLAARFELAYISPDFEDKEDGSEEADTIKTAVSLQYTF